MTVRDDRGDVKQTTTGFRGPLMMQSLTSAKSKFLSLTNHTTILNIIPRVLERIMEHIEKFYEL